MIKFDISLKTQTAVLDEIPSDFSDLLNKLHKQVPNLPSYFIVSYVDEEGDSIVIEDQHDYDVFIEDMSVSEVCLNVDEVSSDEEGHLSRQISKHNIQPQNEADLATQIRENIKQQFQQLLETMNGTIRESVNDCLKPKPKLKALSEDSAAIIGTFRRIMEPTLQRFDELEILMLEADSIKEFLHAEKTLQTAYNDVYKEFKEQIDQLSIRNCQARKEKNRMNKAKTMVNQVVRQKKAIVRKEKNQLPKQKEQLKDYPQSHFVQDYY